VDDGRSEGRGGRRYPGFDGVAVTAAAAAKRLGRWLFAAFFIVAGVSHFLRPALFIAIVPPYLPWPAALVAVSGAAEILLGALLLTGCQRLAGWGLSALLIAVFPANVHMALNAERYPAIPEPLLWARLPLQAVLIAIAFAFTRGGRGSTDQVRS
jgi:uncharacterized membrane protein